MLLLGCGTNKASTIGSNLHEATALRIALSQHKIQTKYFSIDGTLEPNESKTNERNLLTESARITRGSQDLLDLSKITVESYKALIIPSFLFEYDKLLLQKVLNIPLIRSTIKEFHLKKHTIVPVGPSAIQLVGKTLDLQLRMTPPPFKKDKFSHTYLDEHKILSFAYTPKMIDDDPLTNLNLFHEAVHSLVLSMKYRVLK